MAGEYEKSGKEKVNNFLLRNSWLLTANSHSHSDGQPEAVLTEWRSGSFAAAPPCNPSVLFLAVAAFDRFFSETTMRRRRRTSAQHPQSISICKGCSPNGVASLRLSFFILCYFFCCFNLLCLLDFCFTLLSFWKSFVCALCACPAAMTHPRTVLSRIPQREVVARGLYNTKRESDGGIIGWQSALSSWFLQYWNA